MSENQQPEKGLFLKIRDKTNLPEELELYCPPNWLPH